MSKVKSPYSVKMTRKGEGVIEVLVVSSTLQKNNENVVAMIGLGFTVSPTLARAKGGMNFGVGAQFYGYFLGSDSAAKDLDPVSYAKLVESEVVAGPVEKEAPVAQAEVPDVVEEKPVRKTSRKVVASE